LEISMTTKTKGPKVAARTAAPHIARATGTPVKHGTKNTRTVVPSEKARLDAIADIDARIKLLEHGEIDASGNITLMDDARGLIGAGAAGDEQAPQDHSEQDSSGKGTEQKKPKPTREVPHNGVKGGRVDRPGSGGASDRPAALNAARATVGPTNARSAKATKTGSEANPKRLGGLDIAAKVLAGAGKPMSCKEIVGEMLTRKLWTTTGKTPEATIYAAIIREISAKGNTARFKKSARGQFEATGITAETID